VKLLELGAFLPERPPVLRPSGPGVPRKARRLWSDGVHLNEARYAKTLSVLEVICDVSPIQYLHQAGLFDLLRRRCGARTLNLKRTGTLGVLLKAKETWLLPCQLP